jgi:hypothetical protein
MSLRAPLRHVGSSPCKSPGGFKRRVKITHYFVKDNIRLLTDEGSARGFLSGRISPSVANLDIIHVNERFQHDIQYDRGKYGSDFIPLKGAEPIENLSCFDTGFSLYFLEYGNLLSVKWTPS